MSNQRAKRKNVNIVFTHRKTNQREPGKAPAVFLKKKTVWVKHGSKSEFAGFGLDF